MFVKSKIIKGSKRSLSITINIEGIVGSRK